MIIINANKCLMCGDTVFSRARHDFRSCYCGNLSVDGGTFYRDDSGTIGGEKYGRTLIHIPDKVEIDDIKIDLATIDLNNIEKILFNDWNQRKNEYGIYCDHSYTDEQKYVAKAKIELLK